MARSTLPRLLLLATVPSLLAFDYGTPILVRSEADIIELEYMGEIDEELRDQLLDLYDNPLDLNTANREDLVLLPEVTYSLADRILERRDRDPFDNARELRDIVGRSIWNQVKPFVTTMRVPEPPEPLKGTVSARYLDKFQDDKPPVASLKAKVRYHRWLEAGVLVAEEQGPYGVRYDNDTITVEGVRPVVSLERVYASIDRGGWALMMGHYKAGFGQRLTFDVTDKVRPHGFYQDLTYTEDYEDYDSYSVARRLLGVAASTERHLGDEGPRLDLTVFASSNPQDLYYTYFSPHDYTVTSDDEVLYPTFPWVYREDIVGLNATLFWAKRIHAGFTGWGGHVSKAYDFEFTNTPIPNRDFYGALGLDGAYGAGMVDVFGEVALTDTGGLGARAEGVVDQGMVEASLAMRYYGTDFDNPHSRGKSEPDQYSYDDSYEEVEYIISGGDRDRDEIGPQAQVIFDPTGWIRLRAKGDVWRVPSEEITHSYVEGRLDIDPIDYVGFDIVGYMRDKDLAVGGRDQDYDDSDGKGSKNALGAGFTVQPTEPLIVQAFAKQVWEDSSSYDGAFMSDRYAWGKIIWDTTDEVELTGRVKWYDERIDTHDAGMEYWSFYVQARGKLFGQLTLFARYEQVHDLDSPDADPNPEHKLKVGSDLRF
jgi:hypothetical protein